MRQVRSLAKLSPRLPDLIVLDLGLPDVDGTEVITRIRASGSSVPIIVLSSRSDEAAKVDALDLDSAKSLFAMTLAVNVGGQDYLIESIAANEAMGQVYLYRLLVREAGTEAV